MNSSATCPHSTHFDNQSYDVCPIDGSDCLHAYLHDLVIKRRAVKSDCNRLWCPRICSFNNGTANVSPVCVGTEDHRVQITITCPECQNPSVATFSTVPLGLDTPGFSCDGM